MMTNFTILSICNIYTNASGVEGGDAGGEVHPKSFDLLKIQTKSVKMLAKYLKFSANYLKIGIKMVPNVV